MTSLMTVAPLGAGGARILVLGSQPRGRTIRQRWSDIDAVNSSFVSYCVFTDHCAPMRPFVECLGCFLPLLTANQPAWVEAHVVARHFIRKSQGWWDEFRNHSRGSRVSF